MSTLSIELFIDAGVPIMTCRSPTSLKCPHPFLRQLSGVGDSQSDPISGCNPPRELVYSTWNFMDIYFHVSLWLIVSLDPCMLWFKLQTLESVITSSAIWPNMLRSNDLFAFFQLSQSKPINLFVLIFQH